MWQNKVNGVLGIWLIVLSFLDFSDSLKRIFFVLTGLTIVIVAFYGKSIFKSPEELIKEARDTKTDENTA